MVSKRRPGRVLARAAAALIAPAALCAPCAAVADDAGQVAPVKVIAATPLPGTAIDVAKAPYDVRTLTDADLARTGPASLTGALASRLGGVNVGDNLDDPFQPDIVYRGFTASPVVGSAQGLAVYQGGVRINEAFGDAVNWDLVPADAVARVDVVGTNPVYGLNGLGGAVVVTMKNGFDDPGGAASLWGGSFGQRAASLAWGAHGERAGVFIAARGLGDDGWRRFSADRLRQFYADLAWRGDRLDLDLSYSVADNALQGQGPAPVQELAVDRRLVFTSPQLNANRLNFVVLSGDYAAGGGLSFQGDLYVRSFAQDVANGDTTDYVACADPALAGLMCQPDGATLLTGPGGAAIPDLSAGGQVAMGQNDRERLRTLGYGGAVQATASTALFGRANRFSVGADGQAARIEFASSAELGVIDPDLVVQPSGLFVSTPEGGPFTATPVSLHAENTYLAAFATDTVDLTDRVSLTASGRFNWVRIALADHLGAALSGTSAYARFNPALGVAWRIDAGLTAYIGYAEGSRTPTASEIECSDPAAPCLLPSSLSADPPGLKQVVSRTWEAGLRGGRTIGTGELSYSLGLYRTDVRDDIYAVATSLSTGFFQNIAGTRRVGAEVAATWRSPRLTAYVSYAYVDATFRAAFALPSPANPLADAAGDIEVRQGDRLPGVPRHRLKLGVDLDVGKGLSIGGDLQVLGDQVYRGDEANLLAPLPGYAVLGLHANWAVGRLTVFGRIENAANARYATFGILGDPTGVGAPGVPTGAPGADPRFQSPAAPIAAYAGAKLSF
jgi:iron complex outermembrane receptor protein